MARTVALLTAGAATAGADLPSAAAQAARPPCTLVSLSPDDAEALFADGCRALQDGDGSRAVALLSAARQLDPLAAVYSYKLAQAYLAAGQTLDAARLLRDALAAHPRDGALALLLADAYARCGQWSAAAQTLAARQQELDAEGCLQLAVAWRRAQRQAEAETAFEAGLQRFAHSAALWQAWIDAALEDDLPRAALDRIARAERALGTSLTLWWRTAQAYDALGRRLGRTEICAAPGGRIGQIHGDRLLLECVGDDRFRAAPRESAIYPLRKALDAGLNEPAAHVLHARIWAEAQRPDVGWSILRAHEAVLLARPTPETLEVFTRVALANREVEEFLRYSARWADAAPARRQEILFDAYRQAAELYNVRGDDVLHADFLRRAAELRPHDAQTRLELADADWSAGRQRDAAAGYRAVLQSEPGHAQRRRLLQRIADATPASTPSAGASPP